MGCFLHILKWDFETPLSENTSNPWNFSPLGYQSPRQLMTLHRSFILDSWSPRKSIVFHYQVQLGHWSVNELLQLLYRGEPDQSIAADKRKTCWQPREQVRTQICTSLCHPKRLEQGHFQDTGHTLWEASGRGNPHTSPFFIAQEPKGLSWLQPTISCSRLSIVTAFVSKRACASQYCS